MKNYSFIVILLILLSNNLYSQCSDAGICTMKEHQQDKTKQFTFGVSYSYGKSSKLENINYHSARLSGTMVLSDAVMLSFLVPYNVQKGPLGTVDGAGDAIATAQYNFFQSDEISFSAQAGMKFATGNANANNALPQWYQNGLGSNDFLLGIIGSFDTYNITIGYQKAGDRNNNSLTRLKRGDDLLLKIGTIVPVEPFTFNISYLLIQRLAESSIKDTTQLETFINVPNSNQTQLNIAADTDVQLTNSSTLQIGIAFPFLKRNVNVDGLTRAFTLSIGIQTTF